MTLKTSLIDVFYTNETSFTVYKYNKRQIPLLIEDSLVIIMEFDDLFNNLCKSCEKQQSSSKQDLKIKKDYEAFLNKYSNLLSNSNNSSLSKLIRLDQANLMKQLSKLINCIGCRTSIERFYKQLVKLTASTVNENNNKFSTAIDPFFIDPNGYLTIKENIINDPSTVYSLFYLNSFKLDELIEQVVKFKKANKRCNLHSLDYKTKATFQQFKRSVSPSPSSTSSSSTSSLDQLNTRSATSAENTNSLRLPFTSLVKSDWLIVWDSFTNDELRLKSLVIDTSKFLLTLDSYLRKHKFCNDCKLKVIKAYNLLVGESDPNKEKGYCSNLYDGIKCCEETDCFYLRNNGKNTNNTNNETACNGKRSNHASCTKNCHMNANTTKHIHVKNDKKLISTLIAKAEPDLLGSRRERHAKTIDIAQDEVLTCVGIYLYERFHLIYQVMKAEEQTWILLYYSSLHTLKKCLELEFEKVQGISNLELICAELEAESELQQERKRIKKERKKQRKLNKLVGSSSVEKVSSNTELNNVNNLASSIENVLSEFEEENNEKNVNNNCYSCSNNNSQSINNVFKSSLTEEIKDRSDSENTIVKHEKMACDCNNDESSSLISYDINSSILNNGSSIETDQDDNLVLITDEEKNEYYANKTMYLIERINRREMLKQKFQNLKLSANFKIKPRNVS